MRRCAWLAAVATVTLLSGCGRGSGGSSSGPAISIASPKDGDSVNSSSVWIDVHVAGVTLDGSDIGGVDVAGHAHYHVYVDGNAVGDSADPKFLVTRLAPGAHEISVRLFQNDEQPVAGAQPSQVSITIPADAPSVAIQLPDDGASNEASAAELTLGWQNFVPGYWYAFVDSVAGNPVTISSDATDVVPRLTPGWHDLYVGLHHGDGTEYDPPVLDDIRVQIPADARTIQIVSPADGATVNQSPTLTVKATNFTIDGDMAGGPADPNERIGHYHVYVDGYDSHDMWQEGYETTIVLDHIPTGDHDIYVRLMNNDHTSIDPKPVDRIHVHVNPGD